MIMAVIVLHSSAFFREIKFDVFEKLYKYLEANHFTGLFGKLLNVLTLRS